jgi:hypothetical protein
MTISFGYEKPKVIQALRYFFISQREIRMMIILVNVFALISVVLYAMKLVRPEYFFLGTLMWIILMIGFWYILPGLTYRRTTMFKHEFSMSFDNNGFTLMPGRGSKNWPWSALKSYMESPHFFHFHFDRRTFILIPKNGCKDDDEVHELRKLIREHVKKA